MLEAPGFQQKASSAGFNTAQGEGRNIAPCRYASPHLRITSNHSAWAIIPCFLAGLISLQKATDIAILPSAPQLPQVLLYACTPVQHSAALIQLEFLLRTYCSLTWLDVYKIIPHFLSGGHGSFLDFPPGS